MKLWRPIGSGVDKGSVLKFGDGWIDVLELGGIYGMMGIVPGTICLGSGWVLVGVLARFEQQRIF